MEEKILTEINEANSVLILTHVNPDGDTLGSAVALKEFIGEKADILIQIKDNFSFPAAYSFLPSINKALNFSTLEKDYDLAICVDIASIDRIVDSAREKFNNAKHKIIIDHHKTNNGFADINYIRGGISSTGEILFDLFEKLNIEITYNMAVALYCAILTDTGCFKYESTTSHTFEIASKLSKIGINTSEIADLCYTNKAKNLILFQSEVIMNAKFCYNEKVVYTLITNDIMQKYAAKDDYTEGICETLRSISNVDIAFVLKETQNGTKVSIRTKNADATLITAKFNGGGHKRAAGCTIKEKINIAAEKILEVAKNYI